MALGVANTTSPGRARTVEMQRSRSATDGELVRAVRQGDADAYGVLFERHAASVRHLAVHLARDRHLADDVVGEVFANSLRAIRSGGGPTDDFRAYVLSATRNTVVKLRTRGEGRYATPTDRCPDRADHHDPVRLAGAVEHAFVGLPERFQNVLWMTCVEGHTSGEIATEHHVDAGVTASLALRARSALRRSYLRTVTDRPGVLEGCARVRSELPTMLSDGVAASTGTRLHAHLEQCDDCREVFREMRSATTRRYSVSLAGAAAGAHRLVSRLRAFVASFASNAATAATTATVVTVASATLTASTPSSVDGAPAGGQPSIIGAQVTVAPSFPLGHELRDLGHRDGDGGAGGDRAGDVGRGGPAVSTPSSVPEGSGPADGISADRVVRAAVEDERTAPLAGAEVPGTLGSTVVGTVEDDVGVQAVTDDLDLITASGGTVTATVGNVLGGVDSALTGAHDLVVGVTDAAEDAIGQVLDDVDAIVTQLPLDLPGTILDDELAETVGQVRDAVDATTDPSSTVSTLLDDGSDESSPVSTLLDDVADTSSTVTTLLDDVAGPASTVDPSTTVGTAPSDDGIDEIGDVVRGLFG